MRIAFEDGEWIPWTAAQALIRWRGRCIDSDSSKYVGKKQMIDGQTCVLWGEVQASSRPRMSAEQKRLARLREEIARLEQKVERERGLFGSAANGGDDGA
jgi:hypothetical protein